jgi:hypothetical protein
MKKKELSRLLADLETENYFLRAILIALVDTVNTPLCAHNFAMYVVRSLLTAEEVDLLNVFARCVYRHHASSVLTKEWLVETFDRLMTPRLKGKLEPILRAHQKDRFLRPACDLILGPDPTWPTYEDGDDFDFGQEDAKEPEGEGGAGSAPAGTT